MQLALQEQRAHRAQPVVLVHKAHPVPLVQQAHKDQTEPRVQQEPPAMPLRISLTMEMAH